jgi:predicted permease
MTQYFLPVFYSLLQIFILAGIGFVLRKYMKWKKEVFSGISQLIVNITLPAMFISRMSAMDRSDLISGAFFPFYTFLVFGISFLLSFVFAHLFRIPKDSRNTYLALSSFGNAGYIPLALIDIFIVTISGFKEYFQSPLPSLYIGAYLFTYSPILWSVGHYLVTGATGRLRIRQFLTPPVIGILIGVSLSLLGFGHVLSDFSLPFYYIHGGLKTLGSVTSPLILLVLGAMVGELKFRKSLTWDDLKFALSPMLVRYLAMPALFLMLLKKSPYLLELAPAILLILFMETIVPPPANFSIMTKTAGKNEEETAFSILVTYGSYLLVFPVYLMIYFNIIRF